MSHLPRLPRVGLLVLLSLPMAAQAQKDVTGAGFYPFRGSARTIGMAGAFTAIADDTAGLHFNPAGMAQVNRRMAEVSIKANSDGENYFRLAYIEPVVGGKFGGGLSYFRASDGTGRVDKVYQYTYGQEFMDGLDFGVSLRFHDASSLGTSDTNFSFDLGVLYRPANYGEWTFGGAVLDVNEPSFSGIGRAKRIYNVGVAYRPDELTVLDLEAYDLGSVAKMGMVRFGAERQVTRNLALRAGVAEDTFGVGVSLMYDQFTLDYGFQRIDGAPDVNMLSVVAAF